jgi:hypothetical protein
MAMGSGAFLVAAGRYLADRLVEAWEAEAATTVPGSGGAEVPSRPTRRSGPPWPAAWSPLPVRGGHSAVIGRPQTPSASRLLVPADKGEDARPACECERVSTRRPRHPRCDPRVLDELECAGEGIEAQHEYGAGT